MEEGLVPVERVVSVRRWGPVEKYSTPLEGPRELRVLDRPREEGPAT